LFSKRHRLAHLAYPVVVATAAFLAPTAARADFFDDLRRTFQTDIPHFFQDDIPCAFGGKPTSGAKASCNAGAQPAKPPAEKAPAPAPPSPKPESPPANSDQ
jgi:hypothetical protein